MKMIFMGRKKYAAEMLEWTLDKGIEVVGVCTDSHFANSKTAEIARKNKIPIITMVEAEDLATSHPQEIDLVVSYLYWRKIRHPLIITPKYGCINFHPAILPYYRGVGGYNRAILDKLSEWGASAHYVDESIDTGNIIRVYKFNFDWRTETAYTLEKKTQAIQMELYKSVILDVIEKGTLDAMPQSGDEGSYLSNRELIEMMRLDKNKLESYDLDLLIRAFWFPPYSGAGFEINGKFYTLVSDQILRTLQDPGTTSMVNVPING